MKKLSTRGWQIPVYKVFEFRKKRNNYCICVPIFNEGYRIKKELNQLEKYSNLVDIIISDAGSPDGTIDLKLAKKHNVRAVLVNKSETKGQSNQLKIGLSHGLKNTYEGILTVDGNNKDDVSAIPKFVEALEEGFDYVQGSRFIKGGIHKNTPFDRILFNRFVISPILSLAAHRLYTDAPNNFRAYSRKYLLHPKVKPFRKIFQRYELLFYLVTRAGPLGLRTKEIPVTRSYPKGLVPTRIVGFKKILDLIEIFRITLGSYNP